MPFSSVKETYYAKITLSKSRLCLRELTVLLEYFSIFLTADYISNPRWEEEYGLPNMKKILKVAAKK